MNQSMRWQKSLPSASGLLRVKASRIGWRRSGLFLVLLVAGLSLHCSKKKEGETPAQAAAREIKESLLLPEDAQFLEIAVRPEENRLILTYGSNLTPEETADFYREQAPGNPLFQRDEGTAFKDKKGRTVNYAWFVRDPDLYPYQTLIRIAVTPLPKEIAADPNVE